MLGASALCALVAGRCRSALVAFSTSAFGATAGTQITVSDVGSPASPPAAPHPLGPSHLRHLHPTNFSIPAPQTSNPLPSPSFTAAWTPAPTPLPRHTTAARGSSVPPSSPTAAWPRSPSHPHPAAARGLRTSTASPTAAAVATAANSSNDSQEALVRSLVSQSLVRSPGVEAAMLAMDRRDFTSTHMGIPTHVSYADAQVAIGQGATISAPSLHAVCLELLEAHARPGAAVLDVGAGSGYLTGCLSLLVGPEGRVVAMERQERLLDQAGWALARALTIHFTSYASHRAVPHHTAPPARPPNSGGPRCVRLHNLELLHGNCHDDAVLSAAGGPFDAIHVGAAAREVPAQLLALLRPGGRMVLPLGPPAGMQSLTVVDKAADGAVTVTAVRDVRLSPLTPLNAEKPL